MDRFEELQVFLAIIDSGSLVEAARNLRRSPPVVTRILSGLEHRVGTRLLERTTRSLTPTDAGIRLAVQARRLLAEYSAAIQDASASQMRGMLRLSAPMAFGREYLAPLIAQFLKLHADIHVDLVMSDRNLNMIEDGIDAVLRIGSLPDSSRVARRLGEVRRITVASPEYLERRGIPLSPAELANHDTILTTTTRGLPEWRYGKADREMIIRLTPRLQVNDVGAMINAAINGFGIARPLSYQAAPHISSGALVRLLQAYEPEPLPVQIVLPGRNLTSRRLRVFVDYVVEYCHGLDVIRAQDTKPDTTAAAG